MSHQTSLFKTDYLLFILGFILFTIALAQFGSCHGLGLEGSRFVLFAQEMFRHGVTPFPTEYNQYYPDYPVTYTFLTYISSLFFGKVSTLSVVIPTAIACALTLVFTYRIAALHSITWGYAAVLLELATFEFFILARAPSLDQFVTTASAFCFYLVYKAKIQNTSPSFIWITVGLLAGFLFRGAMGLVIPASIIAVFYLISKDYKRFLQIGFLSVTLLIICNGALLLLAYHSGGATLLKSVWNMQVYGRFNEDGERYIIYYYLISGLSNYAPSFLLAILTLFAVRKNIFDKDNSAVNLLLKGLACWFLVILVGLSIPMDKHARYIAALSPAIALLAAFPFANLIHSSFLNKMKSAILWVAKTLPWFGLSLIIAALFYNHFAAVKLDAWFYTAVISYLILIIISLVTKNKSELLSLGIGVTSLLILYIFIVVPITEQFNSLRPLATKLNDWLTPQTSLVFYNIGPDDETNDLKLMAELNRPTPPQFIYLPNNILQTKLPAIFLTKEPHFKNLPENVKKTVRILFAGKVDGYQWVIFADTNDPTLTSTPAAK